MADSNVFSANTILEKGFIVSSSNISNPSIRASMEAELVVQAREYFALMDAQARVCAEAMGDDLKYMGTATVVRDMAFMAQAFDGNGAKINYCPWGASYGSVIGAYLVNMLPDRVGRVVIDGIVDPVGRANVPSHEWAFGDLSSTEKTYAYYLQKCSNAGSSRCPIAKRQNEPPADIGAHTMNVGCSSATRRFVAALLEDDLVGETYTPSSSRTRVSAGHQDEANGPRAPTEQAHSTVDGSQPQHGARTSPLYPRFSHSHLPTRVRPYRDSARTYEETVRAFKSEDPVDAEGLSLLGTTAPSRLNSLPALRWSIGGGGVLEVVREDSRARREHARDVRFSRTPSAPLTTKLVDTEPPFPDSKKIPSAFVHIGRRRILAQDSARNLASVTCHTAPDFDWTQLDHLSPHGSKTAHPAVPSLNLSLCERSPEMSSSLPNENVLKRFARFGQDTSPWARFWPSSSGATIVARSGVWYNTAYTRICSPRHPTTSPNPSPACPKRFRQIQLPCGHTPAGLYSVLLRTNNNLYPTRASPSAPSSVLGRCDSPPGSRRVTHHIAATFLSTILHHLLAYRSETPRASALPSGLPLCASSLDSSPSSLYESTPKHFAPSGCQTGFVGPVFLPRLEKPQRWGFRLARRHCIRAPSLSGQPKLFIACRGWFGAGRVGTVCVRIRPERRPCLPVVAIPTSTPA
uniref:AB hydrolase-1 domain-containing protein n=1 Tax=Mycena chlorophos TaxID=658473 RepID=A0ABQ0KU08_MYCCL|nr:predicted protein [Mycena chlorophos]